MADSSIKVGEYNTLPIARAFDFGLYLGEGKDVVLLPKRFVPPGAKVGQMLKVFVYHDSEDRLIATTQQPIGIVGDIVNLRVVSVTAQGAFMDWGLMKDLFVPKSKQLEGMRVGGNYLVKIYLDERTGRVAASEKIEQYLNNEQLTVKELEPVDLLIYRRTDIGYVVIINNLHTGVLHFNDIFQEIQVGDRMKGYIKNIREGNKIDVGTGKTGYQRVEDEAGKVMRLLKENNGYLPYHDKSNPEEIYSFFGMSKKTFKMTTGKLYKDRKIEFTQTGIKLLLLLLCFGLFFQQAVGQQTYPSTITVAKDGSGNYTSIQEAVNSVRDLGQQRVRIFIKKGIYAEKLVIPSWKTNISLIGDAADSTVITGNDYSGKAHSGGPDQFGLQKFSTFNSYTVLVQGNGVVLENLTIENTAGRVGQAVALHVEGDRTVVRNCRILGNQDSLYTAREESRQFYEQCYIEGTTDFIFGEATCVFNRGTIKSLVNSFITASAQRQAQRFGYVFFDCRLIAGPEATKVYLGRPWRPYAQTVFIRTEMGAHITPEGWNPWTGDKMFPDKEKTAFYAEYQSKGPGAEIAKRVAWSKQLSKKEIKKYTVENILGGNWMQ